MVTTWNKLEHPDEEVEDAYEREKKLISECLKNIKKIRRDDLESNSLISQFLIYLSQNKMILSIIKFIKNKA